MSNALNRLLWWHILLIGAGASLILVLILFLVSIKPKNEEMTSVTNDITSTEGSGGTVEKVAGKNRDLKKAQANTVEYNERWAQYSRAYMPAIVFPDNHLVGYEYTILTENGKHYGLRDLPRLWGQWTANWYDGQKAAGIVRQTVFPVEAFLADPNKISELKSLSFPQDKPWHVTVMAKSFDQAMAHLNRFNQISHRGMPVVDKVALTGKSPELQLDYDLKFYIIPSAEPPALDKILVNSGGSGGGGGGFGGGGFGGGGMSSGGFGTGGFGNKAK